MDSLAHVDSPSKPFIVKMRRANTRRAIVISVARQNSSTGAKLPVVALTMFNVRKHAKYGYGGSGYCCGRAKKDYVD